MSASTVIAAFYRYVPVLNVEQLRDTLARWCDALSLKGTILLASEGINGSVAGSSLSIEEFFQRLEAVPDFEGLTPHLSEAAESPFERMKVRAKAEIVSSGLPHIAPSNSVHVDPKTWHRLLEDGAVPVIDVRNRYEHRLGTFPGAQDPQTDSFRGFSAWAESWVAEHQPQAVAMFCTGGIRCEKAAMVLAELGVEQVHQLAGGVLRYLSEVEDADNQWQGECFVFDDRVSVDRRLRPGRHEVCPHCRMPVLESEKTLPGYEFGVSCENCADAISDDRRKALRARRDNQESFVP